MVGIVVLWWIGDIIWYGLLFYVYIWIYIECVCFSDFGILHIVEVSEWGVEECPQVEGWVCEKDGREDERFWIVHGYRSSNNPYILNDNFHNF